MADPKAILKYVQILLRLYILWLCYIPQLLLKWLLRSRSANKKKSVLFVHTAGEFFGGGEKVLWTGVAAILRNKSDQSVYVLMNNNLELSELHSKIESRFALRINKTDFVERLKVIAVPDELFIPQSDLIFCTVFVKFIINLIVYLYFILATKVEFTHIIDTEGNPVFMLLAKMFSSSAIVLYVHYPFLDVDVFTGAGKLKTIYYSAIAVIYRFCIKRADRLIVNSTWTENKLKELDPSLKPSKIFPPCNVDEFSQLANHTEKEKLIVSFGQFRPEKRQMEQIDIIAALKSKLGDKLNGYKFMMIGSARHQMDKDLAENLRQKTAALSLSDLIVVKEDIHVDELQTIFSKARYGIHTMFSEHFGIGIVEMMSAGIVVITHNSAGPKNDIIQKSGYYGFLCDEDDDFVKTLEELILEDFQPSDSRAKQIAGRAQEKCLLKFSNKVFEQRFIETLYPN